jgi:hypothetical protein
METRLHAIVQDPQYIDFEIGGGAIEKEMPPTASTSRDMQSAKSWQDVVAGFGSEDIGAGCEFAHSQEQRSAIDTSHERRRTFPLFSAECRRNLARPRRLAEGATAFSARIMLSSAVPDDHCLTRADQVTFELGERLKRPVIAPFEGVDSNLSSLPQGLQPSRILRLALLDETQSLPQDLARVLIAARPNETLDHLNVVLGQYDVLGRHGQYLRLRSASAS